MTENELANEIVNAAYKIVELIRDGMTRVVNGL